MLHPLEKRQRTRAERFAEKFESVAQAFGRETEPMIAKKSRVAFLEDIIDGVHIGVCGEQDYGRHVSQAMSVGTMLTRDTARISLGSIKELAQRLPETGIVLAIEVREQIRAARFSGRADEIAGERRSGWHFPVLVTTAPPRRFRSLPPGLALISVCF